MGGRDDGDRGVVAAELYTNLGVSMCDLGKVEQSLALFAKAVQCDPTYTDAALNLRAVQDAINVRR